MTIAQSQADHVRFKLTARLESLKAELALGERRLVELEAERHALRDTLLRISGAVQVLEEFGETAKDGATTVEAEAASPMAPCAA